MMKRILFVMLAAGPVLAGPSVFEHGLSVSNGLVVESGDLLVRAGTNLVPVLKAGDVDPVEPDGASIVLGDLGRLSVAPRYDANTALLAMRVSALDGLASGMVDSWFWFPNDLSGLASTGASTFISGVGLINVPQGGGSFGVGSSGRAVSQDYHGLTGGYYTVQAWVNRTNALEDNWVAFSIGTWNANDGLALGGYNDSWTVYNGGGGQLTVWPGQLGGQWVHFVFTVEDYTDARIYLNGALVTATNFALQDLTQTPVTLGRLLNYGLPLNGLVDEVVLWNRALSSNEVFELYNDGAGVFTTAESPMAEGLRSIYHLDEPPGSTNLIDSGPALNHLMVIPTADSGFDGHVLSLAGGPVESVIVSETVSVIEPPEIARLMVFGQNDQPFDAEIQFSRDGGTSWLGAAGTNLAPLVAVPDRLYLFSQDISLANLPPGTSVVMRVIQGETSSYYLRAFGAAWR